MKMASPCQLCTSFLQLFGLLSLFRHWFIVYLIIQLFVLCSLDVTEAGVCKKTGTCSCVSSRMNVDLSSIPIPDKRFKVSGGEYDFFFYNPCQTFDEPPGGTGCKDTLLCQQSSTFYYPLGAPKHVKFAGSPEDNNLMIVYNETTPGVYRRSQVALICDATTQAAFKFVDEKPMLAFNFELRTSHVCLPSSSQGISTGSRQLCCFSTAILLLLSWLKQPLFSLN